MIYTLRMLPAAVGLVIAVAIAFFSLPADVGSAAHKKKVEPPPVPGDCSGPKARTIITTDGEADDVNSMLRYLAYADCFETLGLVYTSSNLHARPPANAPLPPAPSPIGAYGRWGGVSWIQHVVELYAKEYRNFKGHSRDFPRPSSLRSVVRVGNVDGVNNMWEDTPGSDLIKDAILDVSDPRPIYIQTWGGMNTVARALLAIEQQESVGPSADFAPLKEAISSRVVIMASGTGQDNAYSYIASNWPDMRVIDGSAGYSVWAYVYRSDPPSNDLAEHQLYYSGAWMKPNIIDQGPLGAYQYTYGDGHAQADPYWGYYKDTRQPKYTFVSEGDNVSYLGLIPNGLNEIADPTYGGWGGRQKLNDSPPSNNTWSNVPSDEYTDGKQRPDYDVARWFPAAQNNFAARMKWGVTPDYAKANHAPQVDVKNGPALKVQPGQTVTLEGAVSDPDRHEVACARSPKSKPKSKRKRSGSRRKAAPKRSGARRKAAPKRKRRQPKPTPSKPTPCMSGDRVQTKWWQYKDADTYPGSASIAAPDKETTSVTVPADAKPGETIHLVLEAVDEAKPPMTSYQRVVLTLTG